MKMVVAYIWHEAFEPIRMDLLEAGFPSLTISEVKGSGRQKAITEHYRGSELAVTCGRSSSSSASSRPRTSGSSRR